MYNPAILLGGNANGQLRRRRHPPRSSHPIQPPDRGEVRLHICPCQLHHLAVSLVLVVACNRKASIQLLCSCEPLPLRVRENVCAGEGCGRPRGDGRRGRARRRQEPHDPVVGERELRRLVGLERGQRRRHRR